MMDQVNVMGCNYKIIRVSRDQYKAWKETGLVE